jgi:DNA-binding CsgD family transcriptional regulator
MRAPSLLLLYPRAVIGADEKLVEREGELQAAERALDLIADGDGRVIVIEGPAGIGKTVLLTQARRLADERGFRVFAARGSELEIDFPFGVVRQLFEGALTDPQARGLALADAAAPAEAVFGAPGEGAGQDVSFSSLHGLLWLTLNLAADEPLLLLVDDLHWCDRPSLRFLAYLTHRLDGSSLGVLTGLRSTDPGVDPALVSDVVGGPSAVVVSPSPLSGAAVGAMIGERLDHPVDDRFQEACRRATGGNPLLLSQLLSALTTEGTLPTASEARVIDDIGPRAVSRTVLLRVARLAPEAGAVARAVAILGDGTDVDAITTLTGVESSAVARATGELARAEILRSGTPLGFIHPLVRDVIYQDVPPAERQLLHASAAKLMRDRGAPAEQVAAQLLAAPPSGEGWAVETLGEAAAVATASGAVDSVATYLTRMLAEPLEPERRSQTLMNLGMAEAVTNGTAAVTHLSEAYETLSEPYMRGLAAFVLARTLLVVGDVQRATDLAAAAKVAMPDELGDLADMIESVELTTLYFGAQVNDVEKRFEAFRSLPADAGAGRSLLAAAAAYDWMYRGGTAEECADLASRALAQAAVMNVDTGLTWVVGNVVLVAAERPGAAKAWDEALARSHRRGSIFGALTAHLWQGFTQLRHGELPEAEQSLELGIEQISLLGGGTLDYAHGLLCLTLLERGRVGEAEAALAMIDRPEGTGDGSLLWRLAEIELLLAKGKWDKALEAARVHVELCDWRKNPAFAQSLSLQARALDGLGQSEEAEEILLQELQLSERWGAPGTIGRTLRILGQVRRKRGSEDLERAVELLERSPMKLDLAKALLALGTRVRLAGKPTASRDPLRRAFELAEVCGASELALKARSELHASGSRPRTSALKGPDSLTASENRVAALAAEGQTNKQIAQGLFVTPKTVEVHLSNAYRKLEISSRRELADVLTA